MKRIILSVMVLAFAVAVQAGDAKTAPAKDKDMPCCGGKVKTSMVAKTSQGKDADQMGCCSGKVKTSLEAKGTCPFAKMTCTRRTATKQVVLYSPKALDLVR